MAFSVGVLHAAESVNAQCSTSVGGGDSRHEIIVSVADQKLLLLTDGKAEGVYPVSTSRFGIGDRQGSYATPLGKLFVRVKIGMGQPLGEGFIFMEHHRKNFWDAPPATDASGCARSMWLSSVIVSVPGLW